MHDFIFISYSKRDLDYALDVEVYLHQQHLNTWLFDVTYSNGRWWDEIVTAIHHASIVLAILTPESQTSRWVRREIDLAIHWEKPLYALLLEGQLYLPIETFLENTSQSRAMPSAMMLHDIKQNMIPSQKKARNLMGTQMPLNKISNDVTVDFASLKPAPAPNPYIQKNTQETSAIHKFDFNWVDVPAGEATVYHHFRAYPVEIEAFQITAQPITYQQFEWFVHSDDGYYDPDLWTELGWTWKGNRSEPFLWQDTHWHHPDFPVIGVTWHECIAFCNWMVKHYSAITNRTYHLQSEYEFLRAMQIDHSNDYPWGDDYCHGCANVLGSPPYRTTSVTTFPPQTPSGMYDLIGNVWEWCIDRWDEPYNLDTSGDYLRAVRGCSWNDHIEMGRAKHRFRDEPDYRGSDLGFRMVSRLLRKANT